MKRYLLILLYLGIVLLGVTSCEYEELCYNHSEHALRYNINVIADYRCDWEEKCDDGPDWKTQWPNNYVDYDALRPKSPTGLRVVVYNDNGENITHNINAEGGVVSLYNGYNDMLFYNNDTEYIVFTNMGATTRATTRSRTRSTYQGNTYANEGEPTLTPPDMLYANFFADHLAEKVQDPIDYEVTLQPLVFTYKIRYEFAEGLEYVSLARGVLSGMASSVTLNTGQTSDESASILYDCEVTDYGVRAFVNSFGIPSYPNPNYSTRADHNHALNLEVLLKNGKTMVFEFDITDQVKAQPHGGVIVVDNIVINKEDGKEGENAFDVEVNDWGEYEDVELPI